MCRCHNHFLHKLLKCIYREICFTWKLGLKSLNCYGASTFFIESYSTLWMRWVLTFTSIYFSTTGCTVDYFDHGYCTEPQDKSVILSSPSSSPDTCRGMCTLDISCSGFSFNKLTAECQLSQLSNPKSSLCSSCFFHSKRCTSGSNYFQYL